MSSINVFTTGKNPTSAEIVFIRHALSEHNKVNIGVAFSFSGIQYYSNKRMLPMFIYDATISCSRLGNSCLVYLIDQDDLHL